MANLNLVLDGVTLPPVTNPFTEDLEASETDVTTLDNTLYTDFVNYKRRWNLYWKVLTEAQYDQLKTIWAEQYSTGAYPLLVIAYYDISVPVKMTLQGREIRADGCQYIDVKVTLFEQLGVS